MEEGDGGVLMIRLVIGDDRRVRPRVVRHSRDRSAATPANLTISFKLIPYFKLSFKGVHAMFTVPGYFCPWQPASWKTYHPSLYQ